MLQSLCAAGPGWSAGPDEHLGTCHKSHTARIRGFCRCTWVYCRKSLPCGLCALCAPVSNWLFTARGIRLRLPGASTHKAYKPEAFCYERRRTWMAINLIGYRHTSAESSTPSRECVRMRLSAWPPGAASGPMRSAQWSMLEAPCPTVTCAPPLPAVLRSSK